ncbi:RNA 3'-terminal phosphate cyclase family protein [Cryptosporidium muris RN66]|uniref:RNA 3'-terminal phosphate cyclase family protein n=1 Tax=Cryptosporidium muris (strain RN66) TaxID=441375 RepID=B6AHI0_CRYMR|nr:RNA 3'-terminal phosphate cyclase family protein [Cryptosporidium muris RN66]EEA07675.1 RNA 3'-terminal phosphate cyclase family protein [Cryptosporidium muris RN66]|eukprot:XP_002142024.1 RNA 3'-terminal phosphate cyclase family protein [Cryptosporidium muris RN66]
MNNFTGANFLRQRLVLSTITGQELNIRSIRSDDILNKGLNEAETSLLHLLDKVTDGSSFKISESGTSLYYRPGIIIGGGTRQIPIIHKCHPSRALSYYIEFLLMICPFGKSPLTIKLEGSTDNSGVDHSIDIIRMVTIPLIQKLSGITEEFFLKINRRSVSPSSSGSVLLNIPIMKKIEPIIMSGDIGRVKRIRGIVWYTGATSNQITMKMISKARSVLNRFIPDVWIYNDQPKIDSSNNQEENTGFGMTLISETLKGVIKGADFSFSSNSNNLQEILDLQSHYSEDEVKDDSELKVEDDVTDISDDVFYFDDDIENMTEWERIGWLTATRLLLEIDSQSLVDTGHQIYTLLFMALSQDSSKSELKLSKLTPMSVQFLRDLKLFTNVEFDIKEDFENGGIVILSCTGIGLPNFARKAI